MRYLSSIILVLSFSFSLFSQSPHGKNWKTDCKLCHSQEGWEVDREIFAFDHNTTEFLLHGQHKTVSCKLCHPTLVFSEAKQECMQCHTDIHSTSLGGDCAQCHSPESWIVSNTTEIHQQSRFPLLGAHAHADCYDCHTAENFLRFEPLNVECIACHRQDYMATTQPNHVAANYSTSCEECHELTAFQWSSSGFNHDFFPLRDAHAINDCAKCHTGNDFSTTSSDCISCHQTDYNGTTNPNHLAAGLAQNCEACHTTKPGWKPANFDQHNEFYVIKGAHTAIATDCLACHKGDYANTPNQCFGCHATEYNNTTNPSHSAANFPTDCESCHTDNAWEPASFDHDGQYFPIYSGKHNGKWNLCVDCHTNTSNYAQFSCLTCHEHNRTDTDDDHSEVPDYVYLSTSCLSCHPTGDD